MPFEIVRNDIVNMSVDAIVNTANPRPQIGYGVDAGIHRKAGPKLLEARKKTGNIRVGDAAITPGYDLEAKYVIHTVGPVWQDGRHNEEKQLRSCYERSLKLARRYRCRSVAFPLISTGNYGFPKPLALQIAMDAISKFDELLKIHCCAVGFNLESASIGCVERKSKIAVLLPIGTDCDFVLHCYRRNEKPENTHIIIYNRYSPAIVSN